MNRDRRYRAGVGSISLDRLPNELTAAMAELQRRFPGLGCTLFVFEFSQRGGIAYASNAQRADMVRAIREWLHKEAMQS